MKKRARAGRLGRDGAEPWRSLQVSGETRVETTLILPAYREGARLPATIPPLMKFIADEQMPWRVRIVDDGSDDDTLAVARGLASRHDRLDIQAEPHRGKGGAVRAGMLAVDTPWRVMCDVDMSMPAEMIPLLLARLEDGADLSIASRELPGSRRIGEPQRRHLQGRIFNGLVRSTLVPHIQDTQCGFKAFTDRACRRLFPVSRIDGFAFDVELLFLARRAGMRIDEVPIDWYYDADSRVQTVRDTRRMVTEIARILIHERLGDYTAL